MSEWKDLRHCGPETHPQYEGESNDGSTMTEQVYIPLKDQIEEMILSGRILEAYRKELYHFQPDEEVDESFSDPTMDPGFDAADASVERARLIGKRDRLLKEAEQKRKDEEARNDAGAVGEEPGQLELPGVGDSEKGSEGGRRIEGGKKKEVRSDG
nr:MAG: hypothetical protein [Microviridae sp.]